MKKLILSGNILLNQKKQMYLLYRKDHHHYETPGGKVKARECKDQNNPTKIELWKAAQRELQEEVQGITKIIHKKYFCSIPFQTPDGRAAIAHKFLVEMKNPIEGNLQPREKNFDGKKSKWISLEELKQVSLSPDLKLLRSKLNILLQ